ncbi:MULTISPECIES: XRE family transcriptional regulator [Brevibacillus]|uniref:XRE family transcriptional regulator n=1 Tax=Brevibacillus TaxID=55080 RepID=UPI0021AE1CA8|nr:XRE family transcriptional regulator [Brevibacillus brevis]
MARRGITIRQLAESLGVRFATISDKLNGKSRFFCDEAFHIKRNFFPDCSFEYLFDKDEQYTA